VLLAATVSPLSLAALSAFSVVTTALAPALVATVLALARAMLWQVLEQALELARVLEAQAQPMQDLELEQALVVMPLVMLERALEAQAQAQAQPMQDLELEQAWVVAQREELVLQAQETLPQDSELTQG
jgi:hypothetical protein